MIRQPRSNHWLVAVGFAVAVHAVALVRVDWSNEPLHRAEDAGAQSITIALAPPPRVTQPEIQPEPLPQPQPQAPSEPEKLASAVKTPEPEEAAAEPVDEPEPEQKPEPPEQERQPEPEPTVDETDEVKTDRPENQQDVADQRTVQPADRVQAGATGGIQDAPPDYRTQVSAWLERHKEYPMSARRKAEQGMAMVSFTFDRDGNILDYRLLRPTGHDSLDEAVEDMLKRADPLPKMPQHLTQARMSWTLPVYFRLR